ncbi:MAG: hypothetical protein ACO1RT_20670 [Planctomycetaceae bacterium]
MNEPSPSAQASKRLVVVAVVVFSITLVGLLAPMPFQSRAGERFADFLHLPAFAVLTIIALALSDRFVSSSLITRLLTTLFVVFASDCIELLQARMGRTASLHDVIANSSGAAAALLVRLSLGRNRASRYSLQLIAALLVVTISVGPLRSLLDVWHQQRAPATLASFRSAVELERWYVESADVRIVSQAEGNFPHANGNALEVSLRPGKFPAIQLQHLHRDWTGYESLAFELTRPDTESVSPLVIQLRLGSRMPDRNAVPAITRRFAIQPGEHRSIRLSLQELFDDAHPAGDAAHPAGDAAHPAGDAATAGQPRPSLNFVRYLDFMAVDLNQPATFYLANLRLLTHDDR